MTTKTIDELLHLDTYQGLSDEEIQMIIDKKCEFARKEGADSVAQDLYNEMENRLLADARAARATAEAAFNSVIESSVKFQSVINNG